MEDNIVIVGAGFAARQLVKNIRKLDQQVPITLITADSGDEYNKPDLSHVFSLKQGADDLTRQRSAQFSLENRLSLHANTLVTSIDRQARHVVCGDRCFPYHKLVLATGARAIVPQIPGSDLIYTVNSQSEYRLHQEALQKARRILVLGGGLIGTELAMDLHRAGKHVALVERAHSLLASVMPAEISSRLQHKFSQMGIHITLNNELKALEKTDGGLQASLRTGQSVEIDAVIAAIGLQPLTELASSASLATGRGIQVNAQLQTSDPDIYALGEGAEVEGRVQPFLQPIQIGAMTLAKNVLGGTESVRLPAMLVKVKTPDLPLFFAGETHREDLHWHITLDNTGMLARGSDSVQQLRAFVVSEGYTQQAFTLLREFSQ